MGRGQAVSAFRRARGDGPPLSQPCLGPRDARPESGSGVCRPLPTGSLPRTSPPQPVHWSSPNRSWTPRLCSVGLCSMTHCYYAPSTVLGKPPFRAPGNPEPERSSTPHPGSARLRLQSQTPAGRAACQCLVRRGEAKDAAMCLQSPTPGSLGQLTLPTFPGLCFHLWN